VINNELMNRAKCYGEYSFIGALSPTGRGTDLLQEVLRKFTKTELTVFGVEELPGADVLLLELDKFIDEDLYLTIVNCRQFNPVMKKGEIDLKKVETRVRREWEAYIPQIFGDDVIPILEEVKTEKSIENLVRVAQTRARSEGRSVLSEKDIGFAEKLFKSNLGAFIKHPKIDKVKFSRPMKKIDKKFYSILWSLECDDCSADEIWEKLKDHNIYRNKAEFENLLRKLHEVGEVIKPREGIYSLVG